MDKDGDEDLKPSDLERVIQKSIELVRCPYNDCLYIGEFGKCYTNFEDCYIFKNLKYKKNF